VGYLPKSNHLLLCQLHYSCCFIIIEISEFGSCCGFGDRGIRTSELRGVPFAVLNVDIH
jgi:hypothetical protein